MKCCTLCRGEDHRHLFTSQGYRLVRCAGCGLAFVSNPPDAKQVAAFYDGDLAADYHRDLRQPGSRASVRMDALARRHLVFVKSTIRSGKLVDIGCATGDFVAAARQAGFDASGIELSGESARFAREVRGLPVMQGTVQDCSAAPGSLDVVTAFDVLEHIPDPMAELDHYRQRLKPGGWLFLSTPNIDGLFPRLSLGLAHRLNYWPHPEPPHHLFQFSVITLRRMLEASGFSPGPVRHCHIDLAYSFGAWSTLWKMPGRLAYAAAFAPFSLIGPVMGQGDWIYMAAQRRD